LLFFFLLFYYHHQTNTKKKKNSIKTKPNQTKQHTNKYITTYNTTKEVLSTKRTRKKDRKDETEISLMLRTIGTSLVAARGAIGLRGSSPFIFSSPPPHAQVAFALLSSTPIRSFSKHSKKANFAAQQKLKSQMKQQQHQQQPIQSSHEQHEQQQKTTQATIDNSVLQQEPKRIDEELKIEQNTERVPWLGRLAYKITNFFSDQPLLEIRAEKVYLCLRDSRSVNYDLINTPKNTTKQVYLASENAANTDELLELCGFKRDYAAWFKVSIHFTDDLGARPSL